MVNAVVINAGDGELGVGGMDISEKPEKLTFEQRPEGEKGEVMWFSGGKCISDGTANAKATVTRGLAPSKSITGPKGPERWKPGGECREQSHTEGLRGHCKDLGFYLKEMRSQRGF